MSAFGRPLGCQQINGVRNGEFKQRKSIGKNGGFNQQNCDLMGFNRI
jgi:hypothetical protein